MHEINSRVFILLLFKFKLSRLNWHEDCLSIILILKKYTNCKLFNNKITIAVIVEHHLLFFSLKTETVASVTDRIVMVTVALGPHLSKHV